MSFAHLATTNSLLAAVALGAIAVSSCSRGPAAVKPPSISASGAASKAMELYDKDGDGKIAGPELDGAPAFKAAIKNFDTNGDNAIDSGEISTHVKSFGATGVGLTGFTMKVTMDGQPLNGAEVTFEPDPCLGDDIKAAKGTTSMSGGTSPVIPPDDRPSPSTPAGVQVGLYNVRISKIVNGKETIPARYNTKTTLGQEVSYDDAAFRSRSIGFALKSTP